MKRKVSAKRQRIGFSTTPHAKALLIALCETGLYGRNYHETAERVMCEGLQRRLFKVGSPADRTAP